MLSLYFDGEIGNLGTLLSTDREDTVDIDVKGLGNLHSFLIVLFSSVSCDVLSKITSLSLVVYEKQKSHIILTLIGIISFVIDV